jgi:exoribonuclease II
MSDNSNECPYLEFSVELEGVDENLVNTSWLSQANLCIGGTMFIFKDKIKYQYGISSKKKMVNMKAEVRTTAN